MEQFKLWLKKNATRIFLVIMALLLAGRLYLWWNESSYMLNPADMAKPNQMTSIPTKLEESNFQIKLVTKMLKGMPEFTTQSYAALPQINMFDPRAVHTADTLVAQSKQILTQAEDALKAGNIPEAQRLLHDAYLKNPSTSGISKLRDDIGKAVAAQNSATSKTLTK